MTISYYFWRSQGMILRLKYVPKTKKRLVIINKLIFFSILHTSALGALGRRLESYRPDSNNPSHRIVSQTVFFMVRFNNNEAERVLKEIPPYFA